MKKIILPLLLTLSLAACSATQVADTANTVCKDISAVQTAGGMTLDNVVDPHSGLGVLWAMSKSACAAGVPTPGVSTDWAAMVWDEAKKLIPSVLPLVLMAI